MFFKNYRRNKMLIQQIKANIPRMRVMAINRLFDDDLSVDETKELLARLRWMRRFK